MRTLMIPLFLVAAAATARAQDALTPTDILDFGQVSATARLGMTFASFTLSDDAPATDLDLDSEAYEFHLEIALGLGAGFEVEVRTHWQFAGGSEGDGDIGAFDVETEQDVYGFSDLEFNLNYQLLKESTVLPQWIFGLIVIAPTGDDQQGEPAIEANGVEVQDDRDGAIGSGVWKYGFSTALSKRVGIIEPYFGTSYVFADTRKRNGVTEEPADIWSIVGGTELHLSDVTTIDARVFAVHVGETDFEDARMKAQSEAYWAYGFQAQIYAQLIPRVTVILSGSVMLAEDHEANDLDQSDMEDFVNYSLQIGLHVFLGSKSK